MESRTDLKLHFTLILLRAPWNIECIHLYLA